MRQGVRFKSLEPACGVLASEQLQCRILAGSYWLPTSSGKPAIWSFCSPFEHLQSPARRPELSALQGLLS